MGEDGRQGLTVPVGSWTADLVDHFRKRATFRDLVLQEPGRRVDLAGQRIHSIRLAGGSTRFTTEPAVVRRDVGLQPTRLPAFLNSSSASQANATLALGVLDGSSSTSASFPCQGYQLDYQAGEPVQLLVSSLSSSDAANLQNTFTGSTAGTRLLNLTAAGMMAQGQWVLEEVQVGGASGASFRLPTETLYATPARGTCIASREPGPAGPLGTQLDADRV